MGKGRGPTDRSKPAYFQGGLIVKVGGLGLLLGCCPQTARKVADTTPGFPPERIFGRGVQGWSRLEIEAWLLSPTAVVVDSNKMQNSSYPELPEDGEDKRGVQS